MTDREELAIEKRLKELVDEAHMLTEWLIERGVPQEDAINKGRMYFVNKILGQPSTPPEVKYTMLEKEVE